jgi:hypothetical protein
MPQDLANKTLHSSHDRAGDAFVSNLHKRLPEAVFRECVELFAHGKKVADVARWLMKQDRGGLQHVGLHSCRKYLTALKARVQAIKKKSPVVEQSTLVQHFEVHERRAENTAAICAVAPPNKHERVQAIEKRIAGVLEWISARRVLALALVVIYDEIERINGMETKFGVPMPDAVVKSVRQLHAIGDSLAKLEQQTPAARTNGEGSDNRGAGPEGVLDELPAPSPNNIIARKIEDLNPAQYDKTLTLAKVMSDIIDLDRKIAQHSATTEATTVPEAGTVVPSAGTTQPPETLDGQS